MKTILVDAIHTLVIEWEWIYSALYDMLETYPNRKIILTGADDRYEIYGCWYLRGGGLGARDVGGGFCIQCVYIFCGGNIKEWVY